MSRLIVGSCFVVIASTLLACGSNDSSSNATRATQAIGGDECKDPQSTDQNCTQPGQPPTKPPESGQCLSQTLGGNLCLGADQWIKIASTACAVQGSALATESFSGQCGTTQTPPPGGVNGQPPTGGSGGSNGQPPPDDQKPTDPNDKTLPPTPSGVYSGISFTCCAAVPKPPPPPPCMAIPISSQPQTGSEKPDQYVCPVDYTLNGYKQDNTGGNQIAICCPVQPPPPQQCIVTKIGDGVTCLDKQTVELKAQAICAQSNLSFSSLSGIVNCATTNDQTGGGIMSAEVTCCGGNGGGGGTPVPGDQNGTPPKP